MGSQLLERPQPAPPLRQQHTILIVEDDQPLAEVLAFRLRSQGFNTLTTFCGAQGLSMARAEQPSLVLLDIRLPDIDGLSVCQQLDEDLATCHIPVIILSGMERPDIVRRARAAGCAYFVCKPYDPNALLVVIDHAIGQTYTE